MQVTVSVPAGIAEAALSTAAAVASTAAAAPSTAAAAAAAASEKRPCPRLLSLELWCQDCMLNHSTILLLPAGMRDAAKMSAELCSLPWGGKDSADLRDYLQDLGHWLRASWRGECCVGGSGPHTVEEEEEKEEKKEEEKEEKKEEEEEEEEEERYAGDEAGRECITASAGSAAAAAAAAAVAAAVTEAETCALPAAAWQQGVRLLRQAVLWGMPALSTLLLNCLLALPSAPTSAFAQLAHARSGDGGGGSLGSKVEVGSICAGMQAEAGVAGEKEGEGEGDAGCGGLFEDNSSSLVTEEEEEEVGAGSLGGLLHLALLSPHTCAMLHAVLEWGRCFGSSCRRGPGSGAGGGGCTQVPGSEGVGAFDEPGFAWRWEECNALGFSPLEILATLPAVTGVQQVLMAHPFMQGGPHFGRAAGGRF